MMAAMYFRQRIRALWHAMTRGAQRAASVATAPFRRPAGRDPLTLSTVFRGVQILQTAISGLPVKQLKNGIETTPARIVDRPDPDTFRQDFISETVMGLCLAGNAYWLKLRDIEGNVIGLRNLPPNLVTVTDLRGDPANPLKQYGYNGRTYGADDVYHLRFLKVPGRLLGLGPIQAARGEIESAMDARDYKGRFFTDGTHPTGIISTDKPLDQTASERLKADFKKNVDDVKVLPFGLKYTQLMLSPRDVQYLETQQFDTTQIARLLGIPASLMMAANEGSNLTYSNIEQEWIQFSDFTLEAYAQPIELALSDALPRGNVVNLDWDSMRRSDTKTKAETYQILISAGVLTRDEARAIEGRPPIDEGDSE